MGQTLSALIKGRLSTISYPFLEGSLTTKDKPQDIIVFMVGGGTYEEAKLVAQVNASTPGVRLVMGATGMVGSKAFIRGADEAVGMWPIAPSGPSTAGTRLRREIGQI